MITEPKFPPDISFGKTNLITAFEAYIIDGDTIRDILEAMNCKTASQGYRRAKLLEILEQNTSPDRRTEKEVEL
jgi:hypothetical protein